MKLQVVVRTILFKICYILISQAEECRINDELLSVDAFKRVSCGECYDSMPSFAFKENRQLSFNKSTGLLFHPNTDVIYDPTDTGRVSDSFRNVSFLLKWQRCCHDADKCCSLAKLSQLSEQNETCLSSWDGVQCWPEMDVGTVLELSCPNFIYLNNEDVPLCPRYSKRVCLWKRGWQSAQEITDHSGCSALNFHRYMFDDERLREMKTYLPELIAPRQNTSLNDNNTSSSALTFCCRTERMLGLSYEAYVLDTCARCYNYMPRGFFNNRRFRYSDRLATLTDPETNVSYGALWRNASHPIYHTFASLTAVLKWRSCCVEAEKCCLSGIASSNSQGNNDTCVGTWDGWQCFPETLAGGIAKVPCADHVYFKTEKPSCLKYAEKQCMESGQWYFDKRRRKEWTSYAPCGRLNDLRQQLIFHLAMYAISVAFLIPALVIFFIYKQLQVYRISMHKNLFASLLLNGVCSIILKSTVMLDELDGPTGYTIVEKNNIWCRILLILTKYFRMTNYMWMFCEGYYLHKLIASAFAEQKSLILYYFIGWGFPIIPVVIYLILRILYYDEKCWAAPADDFEWVLNGPSLLSLISNLIFLVNIIRVLLTKLRATNANEPSQYRKAVRATIVLVPLFGLHFLLVIYRPESGSCGLVEGYFYFGHILDGLQGFFVSLAFCYCNGEVLYLLKRTYQRYLLQRSFGRTFGTSSFTTGQFSMSNTHASSVTELRTFTQSMPREKKCIVTPENVIR